MTYTPPQKILDKYADLLVNFALWKGKGVKKGEIVLLQVPECAKPLLVSLHRAVLKAGAHPIIQFLPDGIMKDFFEISTEEQAKFFPMKYMGCRVDTIDHFISIFAAADPFELSKADPKKIMGRQIAGKPYTDAIDKKERKNKMSHTLAMYGTESMAKEANLSPKAYWDQIIRACYLREADPKARWREIQKEIFRLRDRLNALKIENVHIKAQGTDLTLGIGKNRQWVGGPGYNLPSFEVYISPDCRIADGHVSFNRPLYRYGNMITGIRLELKGGRIVKATAKKGQKLLKELIATQGADRLGEFSLTDGRLSPITKFMADTLYDENAGGKFGNMHIAIGKAIKDTYPGDPEKVPKANWAKMGYNDSAIHADIVNTERKTVTATLEGGSKKVIYKDGRFLV